MDGANNSRYSLRQSGFLANCDLNRVPWESLLMPADEKFRDFYAREAEVYEATRYGTKYGRLFRQLHHWVLSEAVAGIDPAARCLEVACGTGHSTRLLCRHCTDLTACDLTPQMMLANQQAGTTGNVEYLQANAFSLPFPDNSFDVLVSTRFLHLFSWDDQQRLFAEFNRVLRPGGKLIIDFDNILARWIYVIPHVLYNLLRYRRLAPFSIYNFPSRTRHRVQAAGFEQLTVTGVGGWHLVFVAIFSERLAFVAGTRHRRPPLSWLAEQFLISGTKRSAA
jgi:ubiquinone/menaquinone biosynthesis C-methylase UbiE